MRDVFLGFLLVLAGALLGGGGWFAWRCLTEYELDDGAATAVVFVALIAAAVACWLLWIVGRAVGVFHGG